MNKYSKIKLKIPPPIVTLVFALLMYAINVLISYEYELFFKPYIVTSLILLSLVLLFPAVTKFYKEKTTINPLKPESSSVLVTTGVYKYSRNPMYLGMACLLIAWGLWVGNPLNIFVYIAYILYMNEFQIKVEELALKQIFGANFEEYAKKVRRWV